MSDRWKIWWFVYACLFAALLLIPMSDGDGRGGDEGEPEEPPPPSHEPEVIAAMGRRVDAG